MAPKAPVQEVDFEEETKFHAEKGDSNRVCTDNPQEKEDFVEVTSRDQESGSTKADPDPLISLLSPPSKVVCSKLLSNYPEIIRDMDTVSF